MEASPYASLALASADRLGKITPALSHTVHMPSHIYLRTGHYNKGITVNENAVNSYKKLIPLYAPVTGNDFLYIIHNLHMQVNNAMMAGRLIYAIESAKETVNNTPVEYLSAPGSIASYMQAISMLPIIVDVRFARWQQLLEYHQPPATQVHANVFYHFGRGMALSQLSKPVEARKELALLTELLKDTVLQIPFPPFSPALEAAKVAQKLLEGNIALMEKNYPAAINSFSQASTIEENMIYTEPRDWLLNPKHYLGNAYLLAGQFANAERSFRKDLDYNNENPWALRGLYQAMVAQKKKDASSVLTRFNRAAIKSDIKITAAALSSTNRILPD
jgi:tetratricopeptide (TPR) repeat protein